MAFPDPFVKCLECGEVIYLTGDADANPSDGAGLIAAERTRQIESEGWTQQHDAQHDRDQLVKAAFGYLAASIYAGPMIQKPPKEWPFDADWWKPSDDPVRNLVKAGALIAAEIDRLRNEDSNGK